MKKRIINRMIAVICILSFLSPNELYAKESEIYLYKITDEKEIIISGVGDGIKIDTLNIPEEIEGIPVIGIDEMAFYRNEDIKKVVFGKNIRYIGEKAFAGCISLCEVEMNDKMQYLGNESFADDILLEKINLVDSISYIGKLAFKGCNNLYDISIPQNSRIDTLAFVNSGYEMEHYKEGYRIDGSMIYEVDSRTVNDEFVIPYGVTIISDDVVNEKRSLKEVIFPDTLRRICWPSFLNIDFEVLTVKKNINEIDMNTFRFRRINKLVFEDGCQSVYEAAFFEGDIEEIDFGSTLSIIEKDAFGGGAYKGESLHIPSSIEYIGENAFANGHFYDMTLRKVVFDEGLKKISGTAFADCNIESLKFPESLECILGKIWVSDELKQIYIPATAVELDDDLLEMYKDCDLVVYGQKDSKIEEIALENKFTFIEVCSAEEMP